MNSMNSVSYIRPKRHDSTWQPLLKRINLLLDTDVFSLAIDQIEMPVMETVEDQIPDVIWQDLKSEIGLIGRRKLR